MDYQKVRRWSLWVDRAMLVWALLGFVYYLVTGDSNTAAWAAIAAVLSGRVLQVSKHERDLEKLVDEAIEALELREAADELRKDAAPAQKLH